MLALLVALALTQSNPPPPGADAPVMKPELAPVAPKVSVEGRSAALFSSPKVPVGKLVSRMATGLLLGSLLGGVLSGGTLIVGGTLAASGSAVPMIIATPLAALSLGMMTALGAALFTDDFGRDLLDAMPVAIACSVISVAVVVALLYAAPASLGFMVAIITGLVFPAIATPLFVQAFKQGDPQPTVALATF